MTEEQIRRQISYDQALELIEETDDDELIESFERQFGYILEEEVEIPMHHVLTEDGEARVGGTTYTGSNSYLKVDRAPTRGAKV